MQNSPKKFKSSPKKYHPKGLTILYEDRDILVLDKVSGMPLTSPDKEKLNTAQLLLDDYVRKGNSKSRLQVFLVHLMDKASSGILVVGKTPEARKYLQDEWKNFKKTYTAVVHGRLPSETGTITSYLAENSVLKMYSTDNPEKGIYAKTGYKVVRTSPAYSLVEVNPFTDRKHQIRVHLADQGCPILDDKKYGRKDPGIKRLTLHASEVILSHPFSKEKMTFKSKTPPYFNFLMRNGPEDNTNRQDTSPRL